MGKGGIIFVVLPRVFVQKNKTCIRRRETSAQQSNATCQDAAGPPGAHTMHTGAVGVASPADEPGDAVWKSRLSKALSSPLPAWSVAQTRAAVFPFFFSFSSLKLQWKSHLSQAVPDRLKEAHAFSCLRSSLVVLMGDQGPLVLNAFLRLREEKVLQQPPPDGRRWRKFKKKEEKDSWKGEVTYPKSRAGGNGAQAKPGCMFIIKNTAFSQKLAI